MSPSNRPTDNLYASPLEQIVDFSFDDKVVGVFADMINRSVPGYSTVVKSIGILAARYAQPDSRIYDLGCSLGAATLAIMQQLRAPNCRLVAVDNSEPMIRRCREHLQVAGLEERVDLVLADINDLTISDASVVVMNFTLQFIAPARRPGLLRRITEGLRPGGVLLLSEKIRFDDPERDALLTEWHHDFKRANGYSDLEISQKRTALEQVMRPDTLENHVRQLEAAGFSRVEPWFQCFNFASLAAFR